MAQISSHNLAISLFWGVTLFFSTNLRGQELEKELLSALSPLVDVTVTINNPVAKIRSPRNGSTEVKLDAQTSTLVFYVFRRSNGSVGDFVIDAKTARFNPLNDSKKQFSIEKSDILQCKLQRKSQMMAPTSTVYVKTAAKDYDLTVYYENQTENNKEYAEPANRLLLLALTDFAAAMRIFNNLSAPALNAFALEHQKRAKQNEATRLAQLAADEDAKMQRLADEERARRNEISVQESQSRATAEQARIREYEAKLSLELAKNATTINLSASARAKTEIALKALRKMKAATEIGVTLPEYSSRLIDGKVEVDEALAVLPGGFLKEELRLALEAFVDVGKAWNQMGKYSFILAQSETGWMLAGRYGLQSDTSLQSPVFFKDYFLSTIWEIAARHVENATRLSSSK